MRSKFIVEWFNDVLVQMYRETGCDDPDIYMFPQTWGSTALGYGGIGCSALTTAETIVLYDQDNNIAMVYLGTHELAYKIKAPNNKFWEDVEKRNILPLYVIDKTPNYYGEIIN